MKRLNLIESINFLNNRCGYIDVENDEDYTNKEIIKIANNKFKDIVIELANDDSIEKDYLKVGWRDILLEGVKKWMNKE